MFRNTNDYSSTYNLEPKVFHTLKSSNSPLPQPKSYTPIRSRLLQGSEPNSTPIVSKLPQRTSSPLLNRILSKENLPLASNLLTKSPSKQSMIGKSRVNQNDDAFGGFKSTHNGFESLTSHNSSKQLIQYSSNPSSVIKSPSRIIFGKNSSADQQNLMQSKGSKFLSKKNSIQVQSPLLSGLLNKRQSQYDSNLMQNQQLNQIGKRCEQTNDYQYAGNKFSRFQKNVIQQQQYKNEQSLQEDIMCMNNDNKKAKYQVINSADVQDDDDIYYYCAKCAIHLIQQGFKVQEIQNKPKSLQSSCPEAQQLLQRLQDTSNKIASKQSKINNAIQANNLNYDKQLSKIDTYYNSLIQAVESLKARDRQTVISSKNKSQKLIQNLSKRLEEAGSEISAINNQLLTKPDIIVHMQDTFYSRFDQYDSMLSEPELIHQKQVNIFQDDLEDKYQDFTNNLQQNFGIHITIQKVQDARQAVSFSFEKARLVDKKISPMQQFIPEQDDRMVSQDQQISRTKEPFRNLFPDQSQPQFSQFDAAKQPQFQPQNYSNQQYDDEGVVYEGVEENEDDVLLECEEQIGHSPSFKNI